MPTEYGEYKNIKYMIDGGEDDDSSERYEGFIKIDNLDEFFCKNYRLIKCNRMCGGWYMLTNVYWCEYEALKGIYNVIDEIEKQYEPGGSEFEKARTIVENL